MKYHQLTSGERYMISALRAQGYNQSEIARTLVRHRSTISREVRRNATVHDGHYRAAKAIEKASGRRSRSRRNQQFDRQHYAVVEARLREHWSPEQISGNRPANPSCLAPGWICQHWSSVEPQRCGNSSSMRLAGCVGSRSRTSFRYA